MDYFGKMRESFDFAWKYKKLWLFGFILALMGGGNFNFNSSDFESNRTDGVVDSADFTSDAATLLALFVGSIIFLIILVIFWYLSSRAKGSLITSVLDDEKGETPSIRKNWEKGKKFVWRYILMDVMVTVFAALVILPVAVFLGFMVILTGPFGLILLCLMIPVALVGFAFFAMVITAAQRLVVLDDVSAMQALKSGYALAKDNIGNFIIGWLAFLIPSCGWTVASCLVLALPVIFMAVVVAVVVESGSALALLFIVMPAFLIMWVLAALVNSPFVVFGHTYWTKLIQEMKK